jgi:hypothetical protein
VTICSPRRRRPCRRRRRRRRLCRNTSAGVDAEDTAAPDPADPTPAPADEGGAGGGDMTDIEMSFFADTVDVSDFTTWSPDTWPLLSLLRFDEIHFPKDPIVSICTVRSYIMMALGMILVHGTGIGNSQQRLWDEMNFAWRATFHSQLHLHVLKRSRGRPPCFHQGAIDLACQNSPAARVWLLKKVLYVLRVVESHSLRSVRLLRRLHQPPRSLRDAGGGKGASKRQRNADPVRANSSFAKPKL